ncbi:MAG TPA: tyrosine-type recombinase/integrase [Anaeromyxobacteraceae bacterium]|nr:tyrosine-type recombinase/integrase [Anaeromyxobacteraceae bacterium]
MPPAPRPATREGDRRPRQHHEARLPHLLRHTVAQRLLEGGMPLFLGHQKLETTQIYASSSPRMIQDSYRRALGHADVG